MDDLRTILIVLHVLSAVALVGSLAFNTLVLMPALRQIPPAHSSVIAEKVGAGLMRVGLISLTVLGLSGFWLLQRYRLLDLLFTADFITSPLGWRLWLMVGSWVLLIVTGTLSGIWYRTVLTKKLPYSAGLRDLEERRAAQRRISAWQERLAYVNLALAVLAALGGALTRSLL